MNWYKKYDEEKRKLLKEADLILEDKEYNVDETKKIYDTIVAHIFSQSKNNISNETNKFIDILQDFKGII